MSAGMRPLSEVQDSALEEERKRFEESISSLEASLVEAATNFEQIREKLAFNRGFYDLLIDEIEFRKGVEK